MTAFEIGQLVLVGISTLAVVLICIRLWLD